MKCHNCPKKALYLVGPKEQQVPLCLDCYARLAEVHMREEEALERQLNQVYAEVEMISGMPGLFPRYPERKTIVHTGEMTLNNIHVSNSEVGVLNTGSVQNIDNTLTVLKSGGNEELANNVQALSEAVIKSDELTNNQKNEILELLGTLSEEAVNFPGQRRIAVVRAVLAQLSKTLGGVAALVQVYEKTRAVIQTAFGI